MRTRSTALPPRGAFEAAPPLHALALPPAGFPQPSLGSRVHRYKGHASFVGSGIPGDQLFLQLVDIMRRPPKPVSATELAVLHSTFSWQAIVPRLFDILEDARREADANSTLADLPPLYPIGWANSQSLRQGSRHKRSSWFSLGGSDDEQEPTSVNLQLPATL